MKKKINLEGIYTLSPDVVAREIHGELIIVPITSGVGDIEDALFTLNATGRAIWKEIKGKKNLRSVIKGLVREFNVPEEEVTRDVAGFISELIEKKIVVSSD